MATTVADVQVERTVTVKIVVADEKRKESGELHGLFKKLVASSSGPEGEWQVSHWSFGSATFRKGEEPLVSHNTGFEVSNIPWGQIDLFRVHLRTFCEQLGITLAQSA